MRSRNPINALNVDKFLIVRHLDFVGILIGEVNVLDYARRFLFTRFERRPARWSYLPLDLRQPPFGRFEAQDFRVEGDVAPATLEDFRKFPGCCAHLDHSVAGIECSRTWNWRAAYGKRRQNRKNDSHDKPPANDTKHTCPFELRNLGESAGLVTTGAAAPEALTSPAASL